MITGIVSSSLRLQASSAAPDYYTGASVVMDFENGVYMIDGVTKTAADMIDRTSRIMAGGLDLNWNDGGSNPPALCSAAVLAAVTVSAGWTVFIDATIREALYIQNLFTMSNGGPSSTDYLRLGTQSTNYTYDEKRNSNYRGEAINFPNQITPRSVKLGCTSAADRVSGSVNGLPVEADMTASAVTPTFTGMAIGAYQTQAAVDCNAIFHRIIIYPELTDAALLALTS